MKRLICAVLVTVVAAGATVGVAAASTNTGQSNWYDRWYYSCLTDTYIADWGGNYKGGAESAIVDLNDSCLYIDVDIATWRQNGTVVLRNCGTVTYWYATCVEPGDVVQWPVLDYGRWRQSDADGTPFSGYRTRYRARMTRNYGSCQWRTDTWLYDVQGAVGYSYPQTWVWDLNDGCWYIRGRVQQQQGGTITTYDTGWYDDTYVRVDGDLGAKHLLGIGETGVWTETDSTGWFG